MSCQLFISHFTFLFLESTDLQHRCFCNLNEFYVARVQLGRVGVQALRGHVLFSLCFLHHTEHATFAEGSVKFFCYYLLCSLMPYLPQYLNSELSVESLIPSWVFLWYLLLWCESTLKVLSNRHLGWKMRSCLLTFPINALNFFVLCLDVGVFL